MPIATKLLDRYRRAFHAHSVFVHQPSPWSIQQWLTLPTSRQHHAHLLKYTCCVSQMLLSLAQLQRVTPRTSAAWPGQQRCGCCFSWGGCCPPAGGLAQHLGCMLGAVTASSRGAAAARAAVRLLLGVHVWPCRLSVCSQSSWCQLY